MNEWENKPNSQGGSGKPQKEDEMGENSGGKGSSSDK